MTARESVLAAVAHRDVHPVPYSIWFNEGIARRMDDHFGSRQWRDCMGRYIAGCSPVELCLKQRGVPDAAHATDVFGGIWKTDGLADHLERPALPEPTFRGYEFPDISRLRNEERLAQCRETIRENDNRRYMLAEVWGIGLYEASWWMRGFDGAMMDAAGDEAFYEELVARIAAIAEACLDIALELPVDAVSFGDDFGDQNGVTIGPARWRRYYKAHYARLFGKARAAGKCIFLHSCGGVADIIPDLIEVGLDVLDPFQPEPRGMNPYDLKKRYGDRITFKGGLGSQTTIPFGTPVQIKAEVARLCREVGGGGGFILAPAKAIRDETPLGNALAVLEAFENQS